MNATRALATLVLCLAPLACSDEAPAGPLCHVEGRSCADGVPCCRFLSCEEGVCRAQAAPPDASTPAVDAGTPLDAGTLADAGDSPDAADPIDAGEPADAGDDLADASTMDPSDAGPPPDGGVAYWTRVNVDGGTIGSYPACVGTAWPLEPAAHHPEGTPLTYPRFPPASGPHWGCWAPWAVASRELPPERFVHNLEHAGIVILYRCNETFSPDGGRACPEAFAEAEAFVASQPAGADGRKRFLVSSSRALATRFAAVAWGWTLERDVLDPAEFACFAAAHLEQGPENVGSDPSVGACAQVYPP
jgi:hypothetical protein